MCDTILKIDLMDYDSSWSTITRTSVRGIIKIDDKLLLNYDPKNDYYSFPGGGSKANESDIDTLEREILEETGYKIKRDTAKLYGETLLIKTDEPLSESKYVGRSIYYMVEVEEQHGEPSLTRAEKHRHMEFHLVDLITPIRKNCKSLERLRKVRATIGRRQVLFLERETAVLKKLLKENYIP